MEKRIHKIRKKRPSLQDAHDSQKKGIYNCMRDIDYVTIEDRKRRIQELQDKTVNMIKKHIPRSRNLELVILKCHLLIEYMLDEFIDLMAPTEGALKNDKFGFKQKVIIIHMLGFPWDPTTLPSIELFNQIRNQIAHNLEINRKKIDELIRLNTEGPYPKQDINDIDRIRALKSITSFICGCILGSIEMAHCVFYDI